MINQTISHYKILEKLGAGGMGVVYKAQDTKLNRTVALKFLSQDLTRDQETIDRFINEAQAASALDHANICTIHEIGETEEGQMFIVMAYYAGETLQKKVSSSKALSGGQLPVDSVIDIVTQTARGLERAHEAGITHRDIKPSNLIITPRGEVKIIDFGLAKLAGQTRLTKTGSTLGTVAYMSPEQVQAQPVDHRSDIWSLGVVLYEMLTGKLPFRGDYETAMVYATVNEPPQLISNFRADIPAELECIASKCLEKDPSNRYQYADEIVVDLRRLKEIQNKSELPRRESGHGKLKNTLPPKNVDRLAWLWEKKILPFVKRFDFTFKRRKANFYRWAAMFGSMAALLLAAYFLWGEKPETPAPNLHRIAVLPLANISSDPQNEYFAEGMTEELIATLSKISHFRVIARTSVMRYKGGNQSIAEIGRELQVETILTGSVRKAGNALRIAVQLVEVRRQEPVWLQEYDREFKEVFAIQCDIARRVAEALRVELLAGENQQFEKQATINLEAYTLYLRGLFHWNKRTAEELKKSITYFKQAIAEDSTYALAYTGLTNSYTLLGTVEYGNLTAREAMSQARAAAEKALAFDDECAEAHAALANIYWTNDWDWAGAEREFTRALALKPNYAIAHHWYAHYLAARGRLDEAMREIKRAQELDPLSLIINTAVGMVFYYRRQSEQAIAQLHKTLEMDSNFVAAQLQLGVVYVQQRRYEEAIATFKRTIHVAGENPVSLALLAHAYAVSGKSAEAIKILTEFQKPSQRRLISPSHMALIYLGLGEKDQVFAWLEKAYQERSNYLIYLKVEPLVDSLRPDPRFTALLNKVMENFDPEME